MLNAGLLLRKSCRKRNKFTPRKVVNKEPDIICENRVVTYTFFYIIFWVLRNILCNILYRAVQHTFCGLSTIHTTWGMSDWQYVSRCADVSVSERKNNYFEKKIKVLIVIRMWRWKQIKELNSTLWECVIWALINGSNFTPQ